MDMAWTWHGHYSSHACTVQVGHRAYVHCNLQLATYNLQLAPYYLLLTTYYSLRTITRVQAGHRVYVHCNGGKGRSAVCTLAYLVSQVSRRQ